MILIKLSPDNEGPNEEVDSVIRVSSHSVGPFGAARYAMLSDDSATTDVFLRLRCMLIAGVSKLYRDTAPPKSLHPFD